MIGNDFRTEDQDADDFSVCMLFNVRKAARAISRRYDRYVTHFGLKAAQFSVMVLVREHDGKTVSEMAETVCMERTTLLRNLSGLERKGLVTTRKAESGKARLYELTPSGSSMLDEALPFWRQAQAELAREIGADNFSETVKALKVLATL
ncbi:MarR family winged helix-turn-helix transcriptional regulator [Roseibium sp.]|uniref:MarR family winged helix-turn-helix transcriptional regulator n=1 Tax=Roseibium sp. TaxID=1936156 RepID=UPI003A987432